jgi:hypothetical protein
MDRAQKHIYVAVNEYLAQDVYRNKTAWPVLQDKLKEGGSVADDVRRDALKASFLIPVIRRKNIFVRFLVNDVATHKADMVPHLRDLMKLNTRWKKYVEVKFFRADVKNFHGSHNKFMVTDKGGFIGKPLFEKRPRYAPSCRPLPSRYLQLDGRLLHHHRGPRVRLRSCPGAERGPRVVPPQPQGPAGTSISQGLELKAVL